MFVAALYITLFAQAVLAYRGKVQMHQPDGTTLWVHIVGNEYGHYYQDEDGTILLPNAKGALCYAQIDSEGNGVASDLVAHPRQLRNAVEERIATAQNRDALITVLDHALSKRRAQTVAMSKMRVPGKIVPTFPTTGEVEGLVVLAEYQDVKFSTSDVNAMYTELANKEGYSGTYASGSVRDYFIDQSSGLFKPHFTVVGPVTLPHERAYYGVDEKNAEMIIDACNEAKLQGTDFSKFDADNDGNVDFVFVVYAGYGEAQGGTFDTVWPSAVDLTYKSWKTYDGLYLSKSACSCELHGNSGTQLDGIGTFVHEFSHILGLVDIYDTNKAGSGFGMSDWDVMDHGCYNNASRTPSGYTAMDKYTVGWLTPKLLETPTKDVRLNDLATSNEAYFLVNPNEPNEYFTLENRQPQKWDKGLPGHGMIVSHVHYVRSLWGANRVNASNSGYEHVALMAADNNKSDSSMGGDPFPGTSNNKQLTDTSTPAVSWHVGTTAVNASITNIREEKGVILFDFNVGTTGIQTQPSAQKVSVTAENGCLRIDNPTSSEVKVYTASGEIVVQTSAKSIRQQLGKGAYIVHADGVNKKILLK